MASALEAQFGFNMRIGAHEPLFGEIQAFLVDEAYLLDEDGYLEWIELLTEDVSYEMPARRSVYRRDGKGFDPNAAHYQDSKDSLEMRARHNVSAPSAWFREPPTRTHRLVTNIAAHLTDTDGEYQVRSSILLLANRFDQDVADTLSARRIDLLRRTEKGLRLAKREILVDQALLAQPFGNLFL